MFDRADDSGGNKPNSRTDSNDLAVIAELIDWIRSGNGAAEARVFRLYGQSNPGFQTALLNQLALAAANDCPYAMSVLLAIIDDYHLARPVILSTGLTGADLADVEQATLIAVANSVHGFNGDARFTTWLHRVARNTAIGEIRRRKPTVNLEQPGLRPAPGISQRRLSSIVAESRTIEALIAELPEAFRTTVQLRDVERLPYQEIADRQHISINTVKSRLNRGRQLLAEQWEDSRNLADDNPGCEPA